MELTPELLRDLSATAILALVLVAVIRGWLVTKRELDAKEQELQRAVVARDKAEEEGTKWQEAYIANATADRVGNEQVAELLESSRTIRTFIQSLSQVVPKP